MALRVGELVATLGLDPGPFNSGLSNAQGQLNDSGSKFAKIAGGIGIGIAVALGASLLGAMKLEDVNARLTAQLGLTVDESARVGSVAGAVFANNYGESLEEVGEAISLVVRNIPSMRDASAETMQAMTESVLMFTSVFGKDMERTTAAVGQMLKTGLVNDAEEAMDLLVVAQQKGIDKSDDLLDTFNEYSTIFRGLGLDAADALGLMQQGLQAGARDSDTVADALKELQIRGQDMSTTSIDGFTRLGLSADIMSAKFAAGGTNAREATGQVIEGLKGITDPVERNAIAVELFGTKAEDLAASLAALDLDTAAEGLGNVEGAAARAAAAVGETASAKLETFKRQLQMTFTEVVGGQVIPALQGFLDGLSPVLSAVAAGTRFLADHGDAVVAVAAAVGGAVLAYKGLLAAQTIIAIIQAAWHTMMIRMQAGGAQAAIANIVGSLNMMKLASIGVGVALAAGLYIWQQHQAAVQKAKQAIDDYSAALEQDNGLIRENTRALAAKNLADANAFDVARKAGIGQKELTDATLGQADALDSVTRKMREARDAGDLSSTAFTLLTGVVEANAANLDRAGEKNRDLARAQIGTKEATAETTEVIDDGSDAIDRQAEAADLLRDALDRLSGIKINSRQAEIEMAQATAELTARTLEATAAQGESAKALGDGSAAALENESAILSLIEKANQHAQTKLDETGVIADATAVLAADRDMILLAAEAAGFNAEQVQALIEKYAAVPGDVATEITANTAPAAETLDNFVRTWNGRVVTFTAHANMVDQAAANKAFDEMAGDMVVENNAAGTDYFRGGRTWINEEGPEVVTLPTGSRITSNRRGQADDAADRARPDELVAEVRALRAEVARSSDRNAAMIGGAYAESVDAQARAAARMSQGGDRLVGVQ